MGHDVRARRKKLTEAGEYWISAALDKYEGDDEIADDLEFYNAISEADNYRNQRKSGNDFFMEPENEQAIFAFLAVQTQFRRNGLRYEGVQAGLSMAGIECTGELWRRMQIIEAGALGVLAERDKED